MKNISSWQRKDVLNTNKINKEIMDYSKYIVELADKANSERNDAEDIYTQIESQGALKKIGKNFSGKNNKELAIAGRCITESQNSLQEMMTAFSKQNELRHSEISNKISEYNNLNSDMFGIIDNRFKDIRKELAKEKKKNKKLRKELAKEKKNKVNVELQNLLNYAQYDQLEYSNLSDVEKIFYLVNDFLTITNNICESNNITTLKCILIEMGIDSNSRINFIDFCNALIMKPSLVEHIYKNYSRGEIVSSEDNISVIFCVVEKLKQLNISEYDVVKKIKNIRDDGEYEIKLELLKNYIKEETELDIENLEFSCLDIIKMLLNRRIAYKSTPEVSNANIYIPKVTKDEAYREIIKYLEIYSKIDSNNIKCCIEKAQVSLDFEQYNEAMEYCEEAFKIDNQSVEAHIIAGIAASRIYLLYKFLCIDVLIFFNFSCTDILYFFNEALKIDPNNVFANIEKGNFLYMFGKYKNAIKYYDKALEIDPSNIQLHNKKNDVLRLCKN